MSLFTQPGHASAADLLMDDPRVAGAASIETSGHRHSARVLPDPRWLEAQTRHAAVAASRSLLGWQNTSDLADRVPHQAHEPGLDDWTDSFTGRPPSAAGSRHASPHPAGGCAGTSFCTALPETGRALTLR